MESVILQISATLVKGKARIQFGASKVSLFSLPLQMYRKSYCTTPSGSVGCDVVDKMLKFYVKVFM